MKIVETVERNHIYLSDGENAKKGGEKHERRLSKKWRRIELLVFFLSHGDGFGL